MKVSNLVQAKTRKGSSFDLGHISTLSVRHAITAAVSRQRRVPLATEPAENMHRCHISDSYIFNLSNMYVFISIIFKMKNINIIIYNIRGF